MKKEWVNPEINVLVIRSGLNTVVIEAYSGVSGGPG